MTILHCGLNRVQESLYNSLPVICVPYAFDHFEIGVKLSVAGAGVSLDSTTTTLEIITNSICISFLTVHTRTIPPGFLACTSLREEPRELQIWLNFMQMLATSILSHPLSSTSGAGCSILMWTCGW